MLLFFAQFLLVLALPVGAQAENSMVTRAQEIRDALLAKRAAAQPGAVTSDDDTPLPTLAELRVEELQTEMDENLRKAASLAEPRQKLEARSRELADQVAKQREEQRARVTAVYRSAKLGAGVAGWHPDPTGSARLSRYLSSVATVGQGGTLRAEVEYGSAIASLDQLRSEETGLLAERAVLEADLLEAQASVARGDEYVAVAGSDAAEPDLLSAARAEPAVIPEAAIQQVAAEEVAAEEVPPVVEVAEAEVAAEAEATADAEAVAEEAAAEAEEAAQEETPTESAEEVQTALEAIRARIALADEQKAADLEAKRAAEAQAAPALPPAAEEDAEGASRELEDGPAVLGPSDDKAPETAADAPKKKGLISRLFGSDGEADKFAAERGSLPPPMPGKVVANYGQQHKSGATYRGVILRGSHSAPVKAVAGGKVSYVGHVDGLGNTVIVSHGGRYHTVYARLGPLSVKQGQTVSKGARLGELPADDADLHFELRDNGTAIDPAPWLRGGGPP